MKIGVITLFPELFTPFSQLGVIGRAIQNGLAELTFVNPRDFATDKHKTVDDKPYGGGPGMVMKPEPLASALEQQKREAGFEAAKVIYVSPQGKPLTQRAVEDFSSHKSLIFMAGRYEGIDQRIIDTYVDEEWSIGDYVISGGELAIMVMVDAIIRLQADVLGDEDSAKQDSFSNGLLDYPHYTRPEAFQEQVIPEVLQSGNHKEIAKWRLQASLGHTWLKRPDLLDQRELTTEEKKLLDIFIDEFKASIK